VGLICEYAKQAHTSFNWRTYMFKQNVGTVDKAIRVIIGLVLISLVFVGPKTAWGWVGLFPIALAALGTCPLYTILGIKTCPISDEKSA
jgi:hypothetical protein